MRQGQLLPVTTGHGEPDVVSVWQLGEGIACSDSLPPDHGGVASGFLAASCVPETGIKIPMSHKRAASKTASPAGFVLVPSFHGASRFKRLTVMSLEASTGSGGERAGSVIV